MRYLILTILFFLPLSPQAWGWSGRVVHVIDGDTVIVEPSKGGERVKIRLHGIDAPEARQPYGTAATGFLSDIALFKTVKIQSAPQGKDRYGRIVAIVFLPNGESIQAALLRAGLAWLWPRYCIDCEEWQKLQDQARTSAQGLWAAPDPLPPWEWRQNRKRTGVKK